MKLQRALFILLLGWIASTATAANEIRVDIVNRSGNPCNGSVTTQRFDAGQAISITIAACTDEVRIWSDSGSQLWDIGRVTIYGSGTPLLKVFVGAGTFPQSDFQLTEAGEDFGGLVIDNSSVRAVTVFAGAFSGNLTGSIQCRQLFRLDVGGEIQAGIEFVHDNYLSNCRIFVWGGGITSTGSIHCTGSALIDNVEVYGDIEGNITCDLGSINNVTANSGGGLLANISAPEGEVNLVIITGDIGSVSDPVDILAGRDLGDGDTSGIRKIQGDSIWANIVTNADGPGDLRELITTVGDFTGALETGSIQGTDAGVAGVTIQGDLNADLVISGDVKRQIWVKGALLEGASITIGHDLKDDTSEAYEILIDDADGLRGQIVINAGNNLGDPGAWEGVIRVGSTTLATAPYYSNLPAALGGGAVGLAPYRIHDAACVPAHNGFVDLGQTTLTEVDVEFYGPVDNADSDPPVDIYIKNNFQPEGNWIEVTDDFDISVTGRVVTVTPKTGEAWLSWRVYRIRPVADELKCLLVNGQPDVATDEYILYTSESEGEG